MMRGCYIGVIPDSVIQYQQTPQRDFMYRASDIHKAIAKATESGWSVCSESIDTIIQVLNDRAMFVPTRKGESSIGWLTASPSHERSLPGFSTRYGLGRFPLHTDGAHMQNPPDMIFLQFEQATRDAPTLLLHSNCNDIDADIICALEHGIFDIGFRHRTRLGTALASDRIRFDPIAMTPRDSLAQQVVEYFEDRWLHAETYESPGSTETLVIDNRWTLHGREAVPMNMTRRLRRLMLRWSAS